MENKQKKIAVFALVLVLVGFFVYWAGTRLAAPYYLGRGVKNLTEFNYPEARENLERSLFFNSKNSETHAQFGRALLGRRDVKLWPQFPEADYAEAIKHYEMAFAMGLDKVKFGKSLEDLAQAFWGLGERDKAIERYLERVQTRPNDSFWARFIVAEDYFSRSNKPEEALDILIPAPDSSPPQFSQEENLYRIYTLLSRLYFYFDDLENTQKYAKLAVENASEKPSVNLLTAHAVLATVYGRKKEWAAIEQEIKKAIVAGMLEKNAICVRANAYFGGGNYPKVIEFAISASSSVSPYSKSLCLSASGRSYLALGRVAEAKKYFQEYLNLTDTFPEKNIFVMRNRERFQEELGNE